ncbi:PHP domain-containing protein [Marinilactibacillus kalidii]|uniref:PHP domain-containing protein n=1 Tax=Marinilactibacillus kalidii TaxID=2820274 RepID=UPI001ABDEB8E|nr:PHP domain-containing protein [Marinilactibacillus kalidii]
MRIDFHTHIKIAKVSRFMPTYFEDMVDEAKAAGLTAICITEHFNTFQSMDTYDYLKENYAYHKHFYDVRGLKVFTGMEVDVKEVGHILIIGERTEIVEMRKALTEYEQKPDFMPFKALMDLADTYDVLRIGGHPLRISTPLTHHDPEQLKRLDAFDLNGRDLYAQGQHPYREQLKTFAETIGLPIVGGSDTHQYLQYGSIFNESNRDCETIDDLKAMIQSGDYETIVSSALDLKVKSASLVKKLIKTSLDENGIAAGYHQVALKREATNKVFS